MKKSNSWTRRDFIAKPAALLAASQILGHSNLLMAEATTLAPTATKKIVTRTLGRTGIKVPIVSMGEPASDASGLVRRAYELGIRHFDTAAEYQEGKNEVLLGNEIKAMGIRKEAIISTKIFVGNQWKSVDPAKVGSQVKTAFEASLKRLQTDYLDILYLHHVEDPAVLSMDGILQTLTDLKKQGRIRAIGVSMHNAEPILNAVAKQGVFDVALFPFNYSMATDKELMAAVDNAHKAGVGLVAMKTTAGNFGKASGPAAEGAGGPAPAGGAAPAGGPAPAGGQAGGPEGGQGGGHGGGREQSASGVTRTALLKWVLHHDAITTLISAFGNYDHIEQNVSVAYDLAYSKEEMNILADKKVVAEMEFCHQCYQCLPTCPKGAEVPTLMRSHMYAMQYYPGTGHPHEALATIPVGRGLDACSNCDSCTASCAWTVNIPRKIKQLQAWHSSVLA
jgi:aryl-alcohol dehydrogenase-like predicted oxidoreductase